MPILTFMSRKISCSGELYWPFRGGTFVVFPRCYVLLCPRVCGLQRNGSLKSSCPPVWKRAIHSVDRACHEFVCASFLFSFDSGNVGTGSGSMPTFLF